MRTGISITITRSVRGRREAITRDRNASQKHAWRAADHPLDRWGAARIVETPGCGKLNLNRSIRHDE